MNNGRYSVGNGEGPVEIRITVGGGAGGGTSYGGLYAQIGELIRRENPYSDAILDDYVAYQPYGRARDKNVSDPLTKDELNQIIAADTAGNEEVDRFKDRARNQLEALCAEALQVAGEDEQGAARLMQAALEAATLKKAVTLTAKGRPRPLQGSSADAVDTLGQAADAKAGASAAAAAQPIARGPRRYRWTIDDETYTVNKALVIPYKYRGADGKETVGRLLIGYQGPGS